MHQESKFKITDDGVLLSPEAAKEFMACQQPAANEQYCCTLLNDDGRPAKRETITASDYNHALAGCVALAHREHYPSGSVRRGAC
jgi:hypothetical protein